ncbi:MULTISPECIES: ABC transporter permease [Phyllobacteriaceae]|jgi:peptide/nickel transport system permease protein|uniref:ABC transporter permease n=1 Tax=Mesorhizobium hungaricum TaxID=1566387 RepID=A0A1C2DJE7_9HYPH|nr:MULTISPECIES: ABC transporter permease [Mesorhizobium]MBN9233248.1 ABC transporter permease [Mesorhizobium sp.]MDQ0332063.1 peptide/nickel transport system permease protein [Mesorhizobium sp. YL-MeA3-2017]OCX14847.1 ABC transporter permease [Mesorhizobium hungaricum]
MLAFILRRSVNAVAVMLAVALMAFMIFRFVGDPVEMMLNEQATQEQRDVLRERLGLNLSTGMQFVRFVTNAAQGDFGISYRNQQDVFSLIAERFPATLELVLVATLLSLVVGVPLGVLTAVRRDSLIAQALQFLSIVGISLPSFALGILLILVFSVQLGWLPGFGRGDVVKIGFWSTGFLTHSGRMALILPSITLALFQITLVMRLVRAEMLETLRSDFIKFARARGLPARVINFRHALRNCLMPVITITGMQIGNLIAFALITETVFQWPGMGLLFIQAVTFVDIPVMAAYLVIVSFIFVSLNTAVDLLYGIIDPRLRAQGGVGGGHG